MVKTSPKNGGAVRHAVHEKDLRERDVQVHAYVGFGIAARELIHDRAKGSAVAHLGAHDTAKKRAVAGREAYLLCCEVNLAQRGRAARAQHFPS